jgi:hypothetical protein
MFFLDSCKQNISKETTTNVEDGIIVEVIIPSGDQYYNSSYLPVLGNICSTKNEGSPEILLIGKRLNQGVKCSVMPIGLLKYLNIDEEKKVIVAVPTNPEYQTVIIDDLVDLSVQNGSIKRIIEQWYGSYSGLGKNRILGWENKTIATDVLRSEISN